MPPREKFFTCHRGVDRFAVCGAAKIPAPRGAPQGPPPARFAATIPTASAASRIKQYTARLAAEIPRACGLPQGARAARRDNSQAKFRPMPRLAATIPTASAASRIKQLLRGSPRKFRPMPRLAATIPTACGSPRKFRPTRAACRKDHRGSPRQFRPPLRQAALNSYTARLAATIPTASAASRTKQLYPRKFRPTRAACRKDHTTRSQFGSSHGRYS